MVIWYTDLYISNEHSQVKYHLFLLCPESSISVLNIFDIVWCGLSILPFSNNKWPPVVCKLIDFLEVTYKSHLTFITPLLHPCIFYWLEYLYYRYSLGKQVILVIIVLSVHGKHHRFLVLASMMVIIEGKHLIETIFYNWKLIYRILYFWYCW